VALASGDSCTPLVVFGATCGAAPVSGVIRFTSQPLLYRFAQP
jgi:hypothetical protein